MSLAVVTGASGHLGANLVRALLAEGRQVRALINTDRRALEGLDLEVVVCDVRDPGAVERAVVGAATVFHLSAHIAMSRRDSRCWTVNVDGTRNVAEACLRERAKLIAVSSVAAYTDAGGPIDETRPLVADPALPDYDLSKAEAVRVIDTAIARGLNAVVVHPSGIVGPHDTKPSNLGRLLRDLARGEARVVVDGGFDCVDARDVVGAMLAAERTAASGSRYLLTGEWHALSELAALVTSRFGLKPPRVLPMWLADLAAPLAVGWARVTRTPGRFSPTSLSYLRGRRHYDNARARRDLGFSVRAFETTVNDAVDSFA